MLFITVVSHRLRRLGYRTRILRVNCRERLPLFLNQLGLVGEGAEVGVRRGRFSSLILSTWGGTKLYSVDPWMTFPDHIYPDAGNVSQSQHDVFRREALDSLRPFGHRSEVMQCTSKEAVKYFQDGQLDFVYLDAKHHYAGIKEDIALWYPKVRKGGVLSGHDYLDGEVPGGCFGVKSAVDECVHRNGLPLIISTEKDWPSWFVFV
jgi:hypothetical protein